MTAPNTGARAHRAGSPFALSPPDRKHRVATGSIDWPPLAHEPFRDPTCRNWSFGVGTIPWAEVQKLEESLGRESRVIRRSIGSTSLPRISSGRLSGKLAASQCYC
jgi:hypothetical protein